MSRMSRLLPIWETRRGSFSSVPLVLRNGDFAARLREMSAKGHPVT